MQLFSPCKTEHFQLNNILKFRDDCLIYTGDRGLVGTDIFFLHHGIEFPPPHTHIKKKKIKIGAFFGKTSVSKH